MKYWTIISVNVFSLMISILMSQFTLSNGKKIQYNYRTSNTNVSVNLRQTNLLFIIFDDLRIELSIYNRKHMITPNFERLAKRAITFDHAYCQVAVCNPSRNSLITGLRPDTTSGYAFQSGHAPFMIFPTQLMKAGYTTEAYGKIRHHEAVDPFIWNKQYDGEWYEYQYKEWLMMNSTVMPDKLQKEEEFRDYAFATHAIEALERLSKKNQEYYMIALGFKMPHLCLHLPYRTFDMYRNRTDQWGKASSQYLSYPKGTSPIGYRCCGDENFKYMNEEGAKKFSRQARVENRFQLPVEMHRELMWGYSASITFVDEQLGRVIDTLDRLDLWNNLTIILTSDHGMHNGEKGLWEKWSLFDESLRVPLLISHPDSPYLGQHFKEPVELIDVYPTLIDLAAVPVDGDSLYRNYPFVALQGKSLAPLVLGENYYGKSSKTISDNSLSKVSSLNMSLNISNACKRDINQCGLFQNSYAVSQIWKCAHYNKLHLNPKQSSLGSGERQWFDCDLYNTTRTSELSLMGYSMRTVDFRYTAWVPFDRTWLYPQWDQSIYAEELYDHRGEQLGDDYSYELENQVSKASYSQVLSKFRRKLVDHLHQNVVFRERDRKKNMTLTIMRNNYPKVKRWSRIKHRPEDGINLLHPTIKKKNQVY